MRIRDYHSTDLPYLYEICLKTGNSGKDATPLFTDPYLIGQYYSAPYAVFEPRCVLILEGELRGVVRPLGYILGTSDTVAYQRWFDREWRPAAQALYPHPPALPPDGSDTAPGLDADGKPLPPFSERIWKLFHQPFAVWSCFEHYPGHLHIDLLSEAQGGGWGRKLMTAFEDRLREIGCAGYHLGVGRRNEGAVSFYRKFGVDQLEVHPWGFIFGKRLRG